MKGLRVEFPFPRTGAAGWSWRIACGNRQDAIRELEQEHPAAYQKYLDAAPPEQIGNLRPIMLESVAEGNAGVLMRFLGTGVHAMTSEAVPFGEIREEHME